MHRSRSSISAFFALFLLTLPACGYGNGAPCEVDGDCASANCCNETSTVRGVCQPEGEVCSVVTTDTGAGTDAPIDVGPVDAPTDSGMDAPMSIDTGIDAPEPTDVPTDAPTDVPANDTGVDAPT